MRNPDATRAFVLLALLFLTSWPSKAQETPLPDFRSIAEEAPEALFETEIGDADVDFYLSGSWDVSTSLTTGFLIRPGEGVSRLDMFPGLLTGFDFTQVPDLTFSVWLAEHYFVEFSVLGSFDNNFFRMGYEGDGLLRHIYLGNRDIAINPYAYLPIPEAGESSLGVEAELVSGESTHELLLRYDNNQEGRVIFVGQNSVDERRVRISDYLTGRFFKLPDEDVNDLEVYIEDEDGSVLIDGSTFRVADLEDAELDAEGGFVTLKAPPLGRVLVYYTKGVSQVGEASIGKLSIADELPLGTLRPATAVDFVASSYTPDLRVPSGSAPPHKILLWKPGAFSPFEILSSYDLGSNAPEELWRVDVKLVRRGGFTEDIPGGLTLDLRVDPVHDRVIASLNNDPRDLENLYPLVSLDPLGDSLYGRYRDTSDGLFDHELLIQTLTPISSYSLGSDVLEGSIRVLRNGSEETRFTFDKASGAIQFHTPIAPTDRLEVTFAQRQSFVGNGDLLFVWGNRFPLKDPLSMEVAAGLRWNALPGAYSETAYSRTGGVLVSATLDGEYEQFRINARTAVSYAHPDTTGILRLAGMEKIGLELSVDENVAYPSSVPQVGTRDTRGQLYYKDYRDYGFLDSFTLKGPEWSVPSDQIFPYKTGSRPGPYNVAAGSGERDKSLALDFSVGAGEWVGVQLPVVAGKGTLDLSDMEALIASYQVYEMAAGSVDLYFELGDIGEDLDDDGLLDEETSAASVGFGFRDYNANVDLLVGGGPRMEGNHAIDTEDFDRNGVLDAEDPARVFRSVPESVSAGGWEVRRHPFTRTDREAIGRTRALRLVLHNTGAATAGRILFDRLALVGSVYAPIAMSGTVVSVAEVREEFAAAPAPPLPLEKAHDVVADTFHAGGETQKVLEIDWTEPALDTDDEQWTVRGFTDTGTEGARYREIVHYMRLNGSGINAAAILTYQLLDAEGQGVTWSFTPTTFSDWREVRVNLEDETVRVGGSIPAGALVTVDDHDSLIEFRIAFDNGADGSSGTLYVDELHLADPMGQLGMAIAVDAELRFPGDLVTAGTLPIISDLTIREVVEASTPGFAGLYGRPTQVWTTASRTETSLGLLYAQLDTHLDIRGLDDRYTFGGGHRLLIPRIASPVVVEDSYNLSTHAEGARFSRANKVTLRPISPLTLRATTAAQSTGKQLGQSWGSSAALAVDRTTTLLEGDLGLATTDYDHQDSEYFASWIKGYEFVLPQTAPLSERTGEFRWRLEREPEPVGINLWLEPGFRALPAGGERDHTATVEYGVAIPIETERNLSIIPRYVRSASVTEPEQGQGSFQRDTALLFYRLWDQDYLYTQIPLWELYAPQTHKAFQDGSGNVDDASYESDLGIELSRRPASRVSFLYLPTRVDLGLGRTLEKDNDLQMALYRVALSYETNAINLFGRLGARPTFDFYAIDEVANTVSLTLHYRESGALHTGNLHVESLIGLEGEGGSLFTVTNRFELAGENLQTASNHTDATYTWYVRPDGGVSLPVLSAEITSEAFYSHEESLSVGISDLQDGVGHPVTVLAGHVSRINLPGHGYLQASLNLGTDIESYLEAGQDRERLTRVLIQAIVEAKIEF